MTSYLSGLAANTTLTGLMIRNYILTNTEEGRLHPDALRNREDRLDGAIAGFATGVDPLDMPVVDLSQDFTGGLNGTNINVVDGLMRRSTELATESCWPEARIFVVND